MESGGSPVQGAVLACPLFSAAKAATQQDLGKGCRRESPPQEHVVRTSAVQVGFQDPPGVAGVRFPQAVRIRRTGSLVSAEADRVDGLPGHVHAAGGAAGPVHGGAEPIRGGSRMSPHGPAGLVRGSG